MGRRGGDKRAAIAQKAPHCGVLGAEMRWTIRIGALIAVLLAVYTVWPFVDLYRLGRAIERRDAPAILAHVEFRALRRSLEHQIAASYLRLTGREARLGPQTGLAIGAAASVLDPVIAEMISPERLVAVFAEGWPADMLPPDHRGARIEVVPETLGKIWSAYANSEYTMDNFYVSLPVDVPASQRYRLRFRLIAWTWKLYDVDLPEAVRVRVAQEVVKALEKK